jgi:hypothetical protein
MTYLPKKFYPITSSNSSNIIEFHLEELIRPNNVPSGVPRNTPIKFRLKDLAERVEETVDRLIRDLQIKRKNNTAKRL